MRRKSRTILAAACLVAICLLVAGFVTMAHRGGHAVVALDPNGAWGPGTWATQDLSPNICMLVTPAGQRIGWSGSGSLPPYPITQRRAWCHSQWHVADLALPTFVKRPYSSLTMRTASLDTPLPRDARVLRTAMLGSRQAFLTSVGWPPRDYPSAFPSWPLRHYRLVARVGGHQNAETLVFVVRFKHRGVFSFRDPTVTGTAFMRKHGRQVSVPFSQTFDWHWTVCVGKRYFRVCRKLDES